VSTPKPIIGLTGGIGSGKSTVAEQMARAGAVVFDADRVAQEILDRAEVVERVVAWWGSEVLDDLGRPDRAKIAQCIFDSPAERERLEGVIHPLVEQEQRAFIASAQDDLSVRAVVLDVPLLLEVGLGGVCDRILFVDAPKSARRARVANRGWNEAEWRRREINQWPLDKKRAAADDIIHNCTSVLDCQRQTRDLLEQIVNTP
jgi:dephospho-CoA kinase